MHNKMLVLMFVCTVLGIVCGYLFPERMLSLRWLDSLFIDLIKLVVIPLIFFSLVSSIISMSSIKQYKSIGGYTACYMLISVSIAALIGIVLSNVFKPGMGVSTHLVVLQPRPSDIGSQHITGIINMFFPPNILAMAKKFEITPLVFFSIVFSSACLFVGKSAKPVIQFFVGMRNIFNVILLWVTYITPAGLFILFGSSIAESYTHNSLMQNITAICMFVFVFLLGLVLQFSWQLAVALYLLKDSRKKFLLTSTKVLLTAFATSSTLDSLPLSLSVAKEQNIDNNIANFVLPFSSTFNLAGTAMYEAVAALFFCQVLNIHLSLISQIALFITAITAGMGASTIHEGGLIKMTLILRSVNVPSSAIALLLPVDRLLDRLRAVVNVWGDLVCTVTVNHLMHTKHATNKRRAFRLLPGLTSQTRLHV